MKFDQEVEQQAIKVPRYVLRELVAQFYGVGTGKVEFFKYTIVVHDPQQNKDAGYNFK